MSEKTGIQWTDATDNVVVVKDGGWFCIKVDEDCKNCYAEAINAAGKFNGNGLKYRADQPLPELMLRRNIIEGWARKTKPKKRFVNSMTDTFGEFVPDEWVFEMLDGMRAAPRQIFQVLTKRETRCLVLIRQWMKMRGLKIAPPNIWLGFSAGSQDRFEQRWRFFIEIHYKYGFLVWCSLEPLLDEITLPQPFLALNNTWVVIGGESGPKARPFDVTWAFDLLNQCARARIPVFMKQLGDNPHWNGVPFGTKARKGGEPGEWPASLQIRQFPEMAVVA